MENYSTPRPMKKIGDLFERYKKHFKAPQASVEKECVLVIKEITGFDVSFDQIEYTVSTRSLYLKVPSILKSELKFHHPSILKLLVERLGVDVAPKNIF
ncbi:hypothetical protein H6784_03780 [Candidatus Nomurabacteria bacterium]|nr:hypothetical protein [Candidatus Kaiserbacteria bacterium]MCB9814509.1 hypothetical protein [Candidatus Nomurabacteria bacterium]